jgi:membrane-anchored protein YejM (alkaline phosphatase superfamily)
MLRFVSQGSSPRWLIWRWAGWFSLLNGLLAALIALRFLPYVSSNGFEAKAYMALSLPAHFTALAALPLVVIWPLALLIGRRWFIMPVAFAMALAGQLLLLIDTEVFAQYRFHLSSFIFDLLVHAGSEIFAFGWETWLTAVVVIIMTIGVELCLVWLSLLMVRRSRYGLGWGVAAIAVIAQLGMHTWHAYADAAYDRHVTALDRALPLYYPATAKRFFARHGLIDLQKMRDARNDAALTQSFTHGELDYPRTSLQCSPPQGAQRPNVLFLTIDAWRADTMNPEATPSIARFAQRDDVMRFEHHLSGGNSTKAGIFSLFYGLPVTYWEAFSAAQHPPVLIDQLQKDGYAIEALGSATLTSPAFDRTVFSTVDHLRTETPGNEPWQRDARITHDFLDYLDQRDSSTPFFGFLFFDAVHGYSVPPDFPHPFQPYWNEVDHLKLGPNFDPTPFYNRYKTAALYVDGLVGQIIDRLKAKGMLDNTIIVITSDHGEEFNDNGRNFWGHGSNYTDAQVHVPLLIHWPGRPGGTVTRTTSHMDIAPSFMQALFHCQAPAQDYSIGYSLFSQRKHPWLLIGSYLDYAVRSQGHIIEAYPTGDYDVFDEHNRPVADFHLNPHISADIIQVMSRFYR